jgi:hypothetical protein
MFVPEKVAVGAVGAYHHDRYDQRRSTRHLSRALGEGSSFSSTTWDLLYLVVAGERESPSGGQAWDDTPAN